MHWHTDAEWAYMISGYARVSCFTNEGQIYIQDVVCYFVVLNFIHPNDPQGPGDIWYFPPGFPHSIQAKNTTADGAEFLLIFDDGAFSEDSTFLLTVGILVFSDVLDMNCCIGLVSACPKRSHRQELPG